MVVADLYDYEQVLQAMRGTQRAYYCPPVQPFMIQASAVFVAAARDAKLESVAHLSMWLSCPAHPSVHTRQQWLTENLFAMIPGVAATVVNPGVFAGPILEFALPTAVNLGMIPDPFGDQFLNPAPSNEDIARVVVGVLTDPDRHAGKRYRPTGPKVLSMADIAATVGRVVGRTVKLQAVSEKMFMKAAKVGGSGDFEVSNVRQFIKDGKLGVFSVNAPTTDVFDVSGQHPEEFEATVRRYAAMPFARRSFGNKLRAIRDFMKIIVTPALNADRYDRDQEQPTPPNPQLAGESPGLEAGTRPGSPHDGARQQGSCMNGKKFLVVGATGHVGSKVAVLLANKGYDVTALVRQDGATIRDPYIRARSATSPAT